MKIFVRAFALALVATGAVASLNAANSTSASTVTIAGKISSPPIPLCPPGVPDGCGLGGASGN